MSASLWDDVMERVWDRLWADFAEYTKDPAAFDAKMELTHDRIYYSDGTFFWWPKDS